MENSHNVLCLSIQKNKQTKQLLYFTWLAARHLVKALDVLMNDGEICVKRKIPSVRCTWVNTEWLSSSGVCVCVCVCVGGCIHTAHVQQKLFVMICMSCHQVFSLYLQICWGLSEPGINITLRNLRVKMREKEGVKWNWVKDLNKQWVEERLGVKTQPGIMWKKESSWRPE